MNFLNMWGRKRNNENSICSFLPLENEVKKELRDAFERVLDRSWYIGGEEDRKFEEEFAAYCGRKYCIGVGNGLDALMLSLKALDVGD